ncbi:MAG TPA: SMC family ATPase [Gemmatimonadaceae bacterium]|nr:SMC family ATPase [Gemmatimonadaceae bacterium]
MRLTSLRLQNFRQHADSYVTFDSGITGIIGPNGSGKTTLLEAIAWALYGNPAARGTRDSIRFNRAGTRAGVRVELEFELGGHRYRVARGLTNAELYLDGAEQPIANSITGVSELLQRRLGMSRGEFFNTYFTGQKELNVMAAMGPTERAQFLSRVLGYEKLRSAQALVRDRRKLIAAELAGLKAGMPDPEAVWRQLADAEARLAAARVHATEAGRRRTEAEAALEALRPQWEQAQRERERLQELQGELRVAEGEEALLLRDVERLDRELAGLAEARDELERLVAELVPLPALRAELADLETLAREEGRRQTLRDTERSVQEELARLHERQARLAPAPELERAAAAELAAAREQLEQAQAELEERRTEWVRDRQEAETKRQALRQTYAELREQRDRLAALGPDGPCPTCTRPLGASYAAVLQDLDDKVETVEVDGRYYKNRLEQLAETPAPVRELEERRRALTQDAAALERRLAKCQAAVQEMAQVTRELAAKEERLADVRRDLATIPAGYDAARHEQRRRELERLVPLEARATRLGAQVEREPALRTERARAADALERTRERLAALRERRDAIDFSDERFAPLRRAYEDAVAAARAAELTAVTAEGEAQSARVALESAERAREELLRLQEKLDVLQRDKRLHDELDRAYSDLRTDLNFALRPELSELASAFLTELTDARYSELELDDQYNVIVLEEGIPKPVISGGEEDLANLVLRLAISQMIAERAGQAFSLLILDEVFGSLDEARRHNVVELLRRLNDRFEQVVLITHIESVREAVDRVIEVRYDAESGSSVVRQGDGGAEPMPAGVGADGDLGLGDDYAGFAAGQLEVGD